MIQPATTAAPETHLAFAAAGRFANAPHRALHGRARSMISFSPKMFDALDQLKVAAAHDVTILLVGESGTGKSHLAQLIHELSPRHDEPLVVLDCGAISADHFEQELLGQVSESQRNSHHGTVGTLALAGHGTCLVAGIEHLPPAGQAVLLRIMETGQYSPVRGRKQCNLSARLILTAGDGLEELVEAGTFRRDLYFKVGALKFSVLPLRERPADVEHLAHQFALRHSRTLGVSLRRIDDSFIHMLGRYLWPGNVRELDGVIHRSVLYCDDGVLTAECLPAYVTSARPASLPMPGCDNCAQTLEKKVERVERRIIEDSLRRNSHHRQATAHELGISRVTLYNKMKKFGMLASQSTA